MAQIAIGDAIGEGFGLIAKRPIAILVWGLARVVLAGSFFALMAPFYFALINQIANQATTGVASPPNVAGFAAMQSVNLLLSIVSLFVSSILYCAVYRSVLFPENPAWAYMRLGPAELFYALFFFGVMFALVIALVMLMIPIFVMVGVTAAAHAAAAGALVLFAGFLGIFVLAVWAFCRLSMVGPMMVEDGNFHLFDAWSLTRGHFWPLFMIFLLVIVILIAIEAVLGVIALAMGVGWLAQAAGGAANLKTFFQRPPADVMATLAPGLLVVAVFSVPVSGCLNAIMLAPWARAYRDLRPSSDVAATFA